MFQAVALQHLHRSGRLHAHITANRGPSLKQSEKIPMYKSAASPVILRALRAQPTRKGPGAVQLPAKGSASHNQHSDPGQRSGNSTSLARQQGQPWEPPQHLLCELLSARLCPSNLEGHHP